MYTARVPRLWNETIESHRQTVREAILDATAELVSEHGLLSVTMSQIAEKTGIGRATLYKYFPDVEAILFAWHERQIAGHLQQLAELRDQEGAPGERLQAVLEAYARIARDRFSHDHAGLELAAVLHKGAHVAQAEQHVHDLFKELLTEVAEAGGLRDDVDSYELATYCLHALGAARSLHSESAVHRLVTVTIAGLRPPQ